MSRTHAHKISSLSGPRNVAVIDDRCVDPTVDDYGKEKIEHDRYTIECYQHKTISVPVK